MKPKLISMKKAILFLASFLTVLTAFVFSGCSEVKEESSSAKPLPTVGFTVFLDEANLSRSAMPSKYKDDGGDLIFAGSISGYSYSTEGTQYFPQNYYWGEYDSATNTVTIPMPYSASERNNQTFRLQAYPSGTDTSFPPSDYFPLLSGETFGVSIPADSTFFTLSEKIQMQPYSSQEGKIDLDIAFPDSYTLGVDFLGYSVGTISLSSPSASPCKLTVDNASSGNISARFFLTKNGEEVYSWNETITVYPGMTTDTWNSDNGEVNANGERVVKIKNAQTDFYVRGIFPYNNQTSWFSMFSSNYGSDINGNGSIQKPFAKVQRAIAKIKAIEDFSKPYKIYADDVVQGEYIGSSTVAADFSGFGSNQPNISIIGLGSEKVKLQGQVINDGADVTLENCLIENFSSFDVGSGITLTSGTLSISKQFKVDSFNNILLNTDTFITIKDEIKGSGEIAKIALTPSGYIVGRAILKAEGDATITNELCSRFTIVAADGTSQDEYSLAPSTDRKSAIIKGPPGGGGGIYPPIAPSTVSFSLSATSGTGGELTITARDEDESQDIAADALDWAVELYFMSSTTGVTSTTNKIVIPSSYQSGVYIVKVKATLEGSTYSGELLYTKD